MARRHTFRLSNKDWNRSAEKQELIEKIRTFKRADRVMVCGEYGTVESIDEHTLTVNVSSGRRKALPYHVSAVTKG